MRETPKCLRCGYTIPPRRRATSDYCTNRCARDQQRADEASAASERAAQDTVDDTARLDWLEAHDHSAMCWNVSDSADARHWAPPMQPNNGWSIESSEEEESGDSSPRGKTLRDAIDWAKKLEARAGEDSTPNVSHAKMRRMRS